MFDIGRISFFMADEISLSGQILDLHHAWFSIQLKIDITRTVFMDSANSVQLDNQGLAGLDVYADLITDIQPVEEDRSRQERGVAVFLAKPIILFKNTRIEYGREDIALADIMTELGLQLLLLGGKINRFKQFTWPTGERLLSLEDYLLQFRREATNRLPDHAFEKIDHTLWESQICALGKDIF